MWGVILRYVERESYIGIEVGGCFFFNLLFGLN